MTDKLSLLMVLLLIAFLGITSKTPPPKFHSCYEWNHTIDDVDSYCFGRLTCQD